MAVKTTTRTKNPDAVRLAKQRMVTMTPERRREVARMGGAARRAKRKGPAADA